MKIFFTTEELAVLAADIFTAGNLLKLMKIGSLLKLCGLEDGKNVEVFFFTKSKRKVKIGIECFHSYSLKICLGLFYRKIK